MTRQFIRVGTEIFLTIVEVFHFMIKYPPIGFTNRFSKIFRCSGIDEGQSPTMKKRETSVLRRAEWAKRNGM